jgi:hypothetical protein
MDMWGYENDHLYCANMIYTQMTMMSSTMKMAVLTKHPATFLIRNTTPIIAPKRRR